jgi:protein-disulfide isomerase
MNTSANPHQIPQIIRPFDHLIGSQSGVIIVEYGDFECPSCVKAYPEVKRLLKKFEGDIGFVFRNFPHQDIHPHSHMAAEAAETAAAQEKFWPMHDLLFENYQRLENFHLREYAESIGLTLTRYDVDMRNHAYLKNVHEHISSGRESGVKATPAFFLNDKRVNTDDGLASLYASVKSEIVNNG